MGSGAGADRGELHPYQDHRQGHPSEHRVVSVRAHVPGNANNKRLSPTSINQTDGSSCDRLSNTSLILTTALGAHYEVHFTKEDSAVEGDEDSAQSQSVGESESGGRWAL